MLASLKKAGEDKFWQLYRPLFDEKLELYRTIVGNKNTFSRFIIFHDGLLIFLWKKTVILRGAFTVSNTERIVSMSSVDVKNKISTRFIRFKKELCSIS